MYITKCLSSIFVFLWITSSNAQQSLEKDWKLEYKGIKIQSSPANKYEKEGVKVDIGEPFIIAAKDDSPEEGYFVTPFAYNFGDILYVNWSFDWDVADRKMPDRPNGRISYDGGKTWKKHEDMLPPDYKYLQKTDKETAQSWGATSILSSKYQTGKNEVTAYYQNGFEVPGEPGYYKVPTWRSNDNGLTWGKTEWTNVRYPGTKGLDIYNPPEIYKKNNPAYLRGGIKPAPPPFLQPFYDKVSKNRLPGAAIIPQASDADGIIYSVTPGWMYLSNTEKINDWEKDYWEKLDRKRYSLYLQKSRDNGRSWEYGGVMAYDKNHEIDGESCFTEPSMVIYPDGEMVCVMRTGHYKPLYLTRSTDKGKTWSKPERLSVNGVRPVLVLLENQILALATGRPDCTIHFSKDRGNSWFINETLYTVGLREPGALSWPQAIGDTIYANSHQNIFMTSAGINKVLFVHDATRRDPSGENDWLKKHGHGLIIGRIITVRKLSDN